MSLTVGNVSMGNSYPNKVSFGAKLPTEDVLQVATGYILKEGGHNGMVKVCKEMTGRTNLTYELAEVSRQCREVLTERFPVLNTIIENSKKFFDGTKKSVEEITNWKNKQVELFGSKEVDVPEFEPNNFEIAQKTAEILKERKFFRRK